jgi:tetratricopeptide (TPR) repeat protein
MAADTAGDDERDDTHFWIDCPGCGYDGKIGVPQKYPADVVVCPQCRDVVRIRPQDRVLWRPGDAMAFLRRRFPGADWEAIDADSQSEPTDTLTCADIQSRRLGGVCLPVVEDVAKHTANQEDADSVADTTGTVTCAARRDRQTNHRTLIIAAAVIPISAAVILATSISRVSVPGEMAAATQAAANRAADTDAASRDTAAADGNPAEPADTTPQRPSPAVVFRRAKKKLANGDYMAAICDFDELLCVNADFGWCYYYRAGAYSGMGNHAKAMDDLDRAVQMMPTEPKVWRARAAVHERMGDLMSAVADIWQAVELTKDAAGTDRSFVNAVRTKADKLLEELYERATAALRSGDCQTAIADFGEVIRHRPDFASAWLRRAASFHRDAQFDKALDDVNVALELRPGPAQAFKLRSVMHERKQDYAAALADMRSAERLDPGRADYQERIRWLSRHQAGQRSQQLAAR